MLVYLNGVYGPKAEARLPVDDRGFLFGDGIYEVTRAIDGRLIEAPRHLERLWNGAAALDLPLPEGGAEAILAIWHELLAVNGLRQGEATVYFQLTRGAAPRTHQFPPPGTPPTVFASAARLTPPDTLRARGAAVVTQPDQRWGRCDVKSINLLPNVLAKQAAAAAGAFEAVLVRDGVVTEGAHTTLFAVIDGALRTHPLTHGILPGITRAVVLEVAAELDLPVREEAFDVGTLHTADELFLASTTADVMPIVSVDGRVAGGGTPGPITRAIVEAVAARFGRETAAVER